MDWTAIGVGITVAIALLTAHLAVMKIIIRNAVLELKNGISDEYVRKEDFDKHVEQCPARNR